MLDVIAGLAALGLSYAVTICVILLRESSASKRARERWVRQSLAGAGQWRPDPRRVRAIQSRLEREAELHRPND